MDNEPDETTDDPLIDEAIAQLRHQPIPAIPPQLTQGERHNVLAPQSSARISMSVWGAGISAAVIAIIGIAILFSPERDSQNQIGKAQTEDAHGGDLVTPAATHMQSLVALRPFEKLEREIVAMKLEVEQLKQVAVSLDAIRTIDAMMTKN